MSQAYAKVSEADVKFIVNVLAFNENPIKTDWTKIASVMGLKNNSVASVRWGQIQRKLKAIAGAEVPPVKPKVTKRKLDDSPDGSAPKVKKPKKMPVKLENDEVAEEYSDDEASNAKNKGNKPNDSEVKIEPADSLIDELDNSSWMNP